MRCQQMFYVVSPASKFPILWGARDAKVTKFYEFSAKLVCPLDLLKKIRYYSQQSLRQVRPETSELMDIDDE